MFHDYESFYVSELDLTFSLNINDILFQDG